jgi:hypothetical protein
LGRLNTNGKKSFCRLPIVCFFLGAADSDGRSHKILIEGSS